MDIEYFDPISDPKTIKSAKKIKELPDDKKIVLDAVDNKRTKKEEYTKE